MTWRKSLQSILRNLWTKRQWVVFNPALPPTLPPLSGEQLPVSEFHFSCLQNKGFGLDDRIRSFQSLNMHNSLLFSASTFPSSLHRKQVLRTGSHLILKLSQQMTQFPPAPNGETEAPADCLECYIIKCMKTERGTELKPKHVHTHSAFLPPFAFQKQISERKLHSKTSDPRIIYFPKVPWAMKVLGV